MSMSMRPAARQHMMRAVSIRNKETAWLVGEQRDGVIKNKTRSTKRKKSTTPPCCGNWPSHAAVRDCASERWSWGRSTMMSSTFKTTFVAAVRATTARTRRQFEHLQCVNATWWRNIETVGTTSKDYKLRTVHLYLSICYIWVWLHCL